MRQIAVDLPHLGRGALGQTPAEIEARQGDDPASAANAIAYTFTTIDVPGAFPGSTMALGINNPGQIVGAFVDSTGEHGFLDTDGSFTTIDPPGSLLFEVEANGINDVGEIVGFNNGTGLSFLATLLSEIPEASSLAVLASG